MRFSKINVVGFFTTAFALSSEEIESRIGDGCANKFSYKDFYLTEAGTTCSECKQCPGSTLVSLFDPNTPTTCVDCMDSESDCTRFQLITTFEKPWRMWFVDLFPSDASSIDDPKRVVIEASNDDNVWSNLYDSDVDPGLDFSDRSKAMTLIFPNVNEYKQYRVTFTRKDSTEIIKIGSIGIVQAYYNLCASELFYKLTQKVVPAHENHFDINEGRLIRKITEVPNKFILSFKLFPRGVTSDDYGSIIRLTSTDGDYGSYGDRWLGMWFHPDSMTLYFAAGSESYPNNYWNFDGVVLNQWNDIRVEAIGNEIALYINDIYRGWLSNIHRPQVDKLYLYAGDPYWPAANAVIRDYDFRFADKPTYDDIVITRGKIVREIDQPSNSFILSFKLFPIGYTSDYGSIILLTIADNQMPDAYGERWLGMWFHPDSMTLYFAAGSKSYPNNGYNFDGVVINQWNDIRVEAIGSVIALYINDSYRGWVSNTDRPEVAKLDVYAGSNYYPAANAVIRDYDFDDLIVISQGQLISEIPQPSNSFILSFKLFPIDVNDFTRSIILLKDERESWLAMWFRPNSMTMQVYGGDNGLTVADGVVVNQWNDIRVEAIDSKITLYINGDNRAELPNANRPQVEKLYVYAGDNGTYAANAVIRDYDFA